MYELRPVTTYLGFEKISSTKNIFQENNVAIKIFLKVA